MNKKISIIVFFVISISYTNAQDINLNDNFENISIGKNVFFLPDEKSEYTLEQVLKFDKNAKFIKSKTDIPFFDYQNSTYWIKFSITNNSEHIDKFCLMIDYPLLYQIKLFNPTIINGFDTLYSGDGFKFNKRQISLATNIFKIGLLKGESKTIYLSIKSDGDLISLPISIVSDDYLLSNMSKRNLFRGVFYGVLFLIFIINFFYYLNMKDKVYLVYMLYVLFAGFFTSLRDGYAYKFLWPELPIWNNIAVSIFSILLMTFTLLLVQITLETKKNFPKLHKIITYFNLLIGLMLLPLFLQSYTKPLSYH